MNKKYYDGFIVHDILDKHLEPGKMMEVLTAFAEAKGVDAVEVIRCRDCRYSSPNQVYGCRINSFADDLEERMYADDFCSRAERREEC